MTFYDGVRREFFGAVTVSGTTAVDKEQMDLMAGPFQVKRILGHVTTAVTGAKATITASWRPTPGTGSFTQIAKFSIPVSAEDSLHAFDLEDIAATEASLTGVQGLSGVKTNTPNPWQTIGPGGEFRIVSDGGASAGVVDFFLEAVEEGFHKNSTVQTNTVQDSPEET